MLIGALWAATVGVAEASHRGVDTAANRQIGDRITVAGRNYTVINALDAIALIPNPTVKTLARLIRACPGVKAYGFAATRPVDIGVVAWAPTNPIRCWTGGNTVGGGDGYAPCVQGFRTPDRQLYVVFAGSSRRVCPHIATQTPGGWGARTTGSVPGLPAGSAIRVKCQRWSGGRLMDFVAPYAARLPASKPAFWIADARVATGYDELPGVPRCEGYRITW